MGVDGAAEGLRPSKLHEKKLKRQENKRGVVYISRIPPHLKPQKLRQMLEEHAEIGRLYLAPEDPALRKKRKEKGGNSGKNFTEGWVEFEDKQKAKEVVALLNGQQMGGKRRSAYFYDLWCLKYLPKFKWDHLTEEVNYQKAVREQRLAAEISAAKRERDFYLGQVDRAKGLHAALERKRKREESGAGLSDRGGGGDAQPQQPPPQQQQVQEQPHSGPDGGGGGGGPPGGTQQAKHRGGGGKARQQPSSTAAIEGSSGGGVGGGGGMKVLRTYGQRRPKADPVTDAAAPKLSSGLLKLIAGQQNGS